MTAPSWLAFDVVGVSLLATVAVLAGMSRVATRARWSERDRMTTTRLAVVALAAWFVVALGLSASGFYRATDVDVPRLPFALLPAVIGGVFLSRSKALGRLLDAAPQAWVVGVQVYRAFGVSFLVLWATGYLPAVFAVPAGLGDMAVGLLAVIVARVASQQRPGHAWLVGAWNVLGLLDFVGAFATGFLSVPTPLHPVAPDHSSILITMFPLALIPTYLVPFSMLLHVASLTKLARERSSRRSGTPPRDRDAWLGEPS